MIGFEDGWGFNCSDGTSVVKTADGGVVSPRILSKFMVAGCRFQVAGCVFSVAILGMTTSVLRIHSCFTGVTGRRFSVFCKSLMMDMSSLRES